MLSGRLLGVRLALVEGEQHGVPAERATARQMRARGGSPAAPDEDGRSAVSLTGMEPVPTAEQSRSWDGLLGLA